MEYLAHSAKGDYPAQSYTAHITGVMERAERYAREAGAYAKADGELLTRVVHNSALYHDLGKLLEENQTVLCGKVKGNHLPINHVDAGTAELLNQEELFSALNVYSHHKGLPDMAAEQIREDAFFRDDSPKTREKVDASLQQLESIHEKLVSDSIQPIESTCIGDVTVFSRMMLSCLADGDFSDTGRVYGTTPEKEEVPSLRPEERLHALDIFVGGLGGTGERNRLRKEMYQSCRDSNSKSGFAICDSPVGSGKTTAVMAHLLHQAQIRDSRRIFVVLPYTSIITQSVEVYRKALVLPGENPEEVVAELHCRADFESKDTRYLTALWRAPIVVTTAVAFFETLASNHPASLRRLHELPGSIIFVDESHNALPLKLLPLAWRWMNILSEEWSCYWILASGSLVHFWELSSLQQVSMPRPEIGELVSTPLREQLMTYEKNRIRFCWEESPLSRSSLREKVQSAEGPRLLIMNTVRKAAIIANDLAEAYGRDSVEHLSTALSAEDRDAAIARVRDRLNDPEDRNWTLVATSCVEAGVDFSFRTGFREVASVLSLLQAAGRVNRHGDQRNAAMWSFTMQDDSYLKGDLPIEAAKEVTKEFFRSQIPITPELSTKAVNQEIIRDDTAIPTMERLLSNEEAAQMKTIAEDFVVIESDTVAVVVDEKLRQQIQYGKGDWRQLQRKSVSIRWNKEREWKLQRIASGVYAWTLGYNSFLGYMQGVLDLEKAKDGLMLY